MRVASIVFIVSALSAQRPERFDLIVREDIFAGFLANDMARFNKGMKVCEDQLARDPKHSAAAVWKAGGTLYLATRAFKEGDAKRGNELWDQAIKRFEDAHAAAPNDVGVLATYGGSLVVMVRLAPPEHTREMMSRARTLYERILEIQSPYLDKMGVHHRGEVLGGLADINQRLGQTEKSQQYLRRIVSSMEGTAYARKAAKWIENPAAIQASDSMACQSCHVVAQRPPA